MPLNLPAYKKTVTAVVGALLTWATVVVTSDPARITASEWLLLGGSLATALGVYATRNEASTEGDLGGDRGAVEPGSFALGIIVCAVILWFAAAR